MGVSITPQERIVRNTVLKALLVHFQKDETLLRFASPQIEEEVKQRAVQEKISFLELLDEGNWLQRIHFSWFLPFLSTRPPQLIGSYLSLFPEATKRAIALSLKREVPSLKISRFGQAVLLKHLKSGIGAHAVLPFPLLAPSKFSRLIVLPQKKMVALIDFLGLHDLAAETKQIVDKKLLEQIHQALSESERQFLTYCTKQVIRWVPPKLNLKGWNGNPEALHAILHARGIGRLAKATMGEESAFCWHLAHSLDSNRGKVLIESYQQPVERTLVPYFQKQVFELLEQLK